MENPVLSEDDRELLHSILAKLEVTEQVWQDLERALAEMPQCLVHGDFVGKNVRVMQTEGGRELYVMDWDISGWGAPACDIERIVPSLYRKAVKDTWPELTLDRIEQMRVVGRILRNVGLIQATSTSLYYDWVEGPMRELSLYESILGESLRQFCLA